MKLSTLEYDILKNAVYPIVGHGTIEAVWCHNSRSQTHFKQQLRKMFDAAEIIKPRTYKSLELPYWSCVQFSLGAAYRQFVRVFKHSMNKHYKKA